MARVLLLLPTTTYRTKAFLDAARRLGVEIVAASELSSAFESQNPEGLITLDFLDPARAARQAAHYAREHKIDAVVPVDEDTAVAAAAVARAVSLNYNSARSATIAKHKRMMRESLKQAGARVPSFQAFSLDEDPREIAARVDFPCVIKPVFLSTSRGVMRADNAEELAGALARLNRIVSNPRIARRGGAASREVLIEEFIPGFEVAVEGLVSDGRFQMLAIFDKPDPLDGPFFEETIYVTPSRLTDDVQKSIYDATSEAIRAMGLSRGPIHAELRVNDSGPWVIEVAARAIGGLCSRALRFDDGASLEEVIIRHALGHDLSSIQRETLAAAVMMIPIPRAGVLREVLGVEDARRVADIEDIIITAHITQEIIPPPEGASYLGFIFSRAESAERAEAAVREAHQRIEFIIE